MQDTSQAVASFHVLGMVGVLNKPSDDKTCSSCSSAIESMVGSVKGVSSVNVSLMNESADVVYDPNVLREVCINPILDSHKPGGCVEGDARHWIRSENQRKGTITPLGKV